MLTRRRSQTLHTTTALSVLASGLLLIPCAASAFTVERKEGMNTVERPEGMEEPPEQTEGQIRVPVDWTPEERLAPQEVPQGTGTVDASIAGKQVVERILVSGNQRIEPRTIVTYLGIREGERVDRYDIDEGMRSLFASGFFADVSLRMQADGRLQVKVEENPTVSRVVFEGNDALDDEDLQKEIQLKPRSIYTRPTIQNDLARILELYRRSGRYAAQVEPKVILREQNRVDVVFEIQEGDVTLVRGIQFVGNEAYSSSTLRDVIRTSEECFYCFLSNDDKYDPDRLLFDQQLLRKFYTSQGYADFKVESAIAELSPEQDGFYLTFTIEEGPKYTLGDVTFDSKLAGVNESRFVELVTTKTGDLYNAEAMENSIDVMVDELGDQGFAFVDINPKMTRNQEDLTIDLAYEIEEGPRVYVERININGNMRTLDEVVRREFRLAEGDPFSTSKLQRSEQRLKNLGFFETVKVTNERGSAPDRVVINVEVQEQSTGELSLGAGFSSTDGALADVGIREKNLLGRGQDLRFRATLATERQQFDIGFTEPYFLDREVKAGFDIFKITQDFRSESSFDRESVGGRLRAGYKLTEHLDHSLKYSYEQVDITDVSDTASRFVRDQEGTNVTSLVGHALTYDKRNNAFDPSEGYYLRLSQDVAGLGGDSQFFRNEAQASWYYPVYPQWVFMIGGSAGHVLGFDDKLNIQDRFFVGGRSLRGFDNAGIGPRDITTGDALGGNLYYTITAEQQFPLGLDEFGITGAIFVEAGSLYDVDESGPEVVDEASLRAAAGFGLGWKSPFGPIRIDFSQAFLKETYDETESIRFNFGTRF